MTALLTLLDTFAIWIYLACVLVILFGIKMLFDARRAARTTLFTLEQEQASDRAFRAVLVMGTATLLIAGVAAVNAFVSPALPTVEPDGIEPTKVPYTPPIILPTATSLPTLTLPPPTAAPTTAPTQAAAATRAPVQPTAAPVQPTAAPPPTEAVTPVPTQPSALIYPAPPLNTPPNGDSIGASNIRFSWGVNRDSGAYDVPQNLPPDQFYRITVSYTDRSQNQPAAIVVCLHETAIDRRTGLDLTDYRTEAVNGDFTWNVVIVSAASPQACEAGEFTPLSPPSPTFGFKLP